MDRRETRSERSPGVLRNRNFALLWGGQAVSVAGNGMFTVALPLEVLRITSRPLDLAVVVSARTIPSVLTLLLGGMVADRISRRLVMLVSDGVCGASVLLLAVITYRNETRLWELILLSIVFGFSSAFFLPASTVIVRDILPASSLVAASSLSSLSQSLGQYLAGPLAGGVIVAAVGTAWAFAIDGASFLISAVCLAAMRVPTAQAGAVSETARGGIREGLRYSRSLPWLWGSFTAVGIANLVAFVPLVVLEALLVRLVFKAGPLALGSMYAGSGVGGGVASLYLKRRGGPRRRVTAIWVSWGGAGAAIVALGLSPWLWMAIVCAALAWGGVTYGNTLWFPLMQAEVPPDMLGRVSSIDWLISLALSPLGILAGGAAAGAIGVRATLILGGAAAAAMAAVLLVPGVRDPDHRARDSTADRA